MKSSSNSILFVGQAFYNSWYLSRELRKLGWKAVLINIDNSHETQKFYHGEDISFSYTVDDLPFRLNTYINSLNEFTIFHFSNQKGIYFLKETYSSGRIKLLFPLVERIINIFISHRSLDEILHRLESFRLIKKKEKFVVTRFGIWLYKVLLRKWLNNKYGDFWDIELLKIAGKKIGYSNNGCLDGALKSSFSKWGPINTCKSVCKFYDRPEICSDHLNSEWGKFRNRIADYQCNIGCNKVDYNDVPEVLESPWFYCLDTNFWKPDLLIPSNYLLPFGPEIVKIYHSVGNFEGRSDAANKNIKCTHIYLDLIDRYKKEGLPVELIFFHGIPNKILRYYQVQADIVVDMLTFGFFGANIREAMMLGKPAICYLRPEWLAIMSEEIPEYVRDLPVISATPDSVEEILRDLINNKAKREEIGRRSREFAVKWHGSEIAAKYFDKFLKLVVQEDLNKENVFNIQNEIYN